MLCRDIDALTEDMAMAGERGFQLDMFSVPDEGATVDAAPPMLVAGGWQMAETGAFAAALKRGALGEALGVLNRVKVDVAWKVLLEAGFTVGSSASRAEMMAPVQKDIIEAAQRGMTGRELREAREKAAAVQELPPAEEAPATTPLLSAEQKIRAAFEALPDKTLGKAQAIHVEHNGTTRTFLAYANNPPSLANQMRGLRTPIHLAVIKAGRMIAGDPIQPIVNTFTLNGRDELKETGMPRVATADDLKQWADAGLENPVPGVRKTEPIKLSEKSNTEDAGAELTYNKRNRIKTGIRWGDIEGMEPALRVRETVKAKVFPKPDYEALIAAGMQPVHAHIVKQIYDSLAAKPATRAPTDEQLRHYIEGVNRVMSGALAWAASPSGAGAWDGRTMTSKALLDAVYPNGWKEYREEVSLLGGNRFYGAMQPGSTELRRANKAIGDGWPASREAWEKQGFSVVFADEVKRGVYVGSRRSGASYVSLSFRVNGKTIDNVIVEGASSEIDESVQVAIAARETEIAGKFLLLNKRGQLVSAHEDEEGAKEAARSAVKRGTDKGISEIGIHVENAVRLGVERRPAGVDVSTEQLIETFGFKGVNFGTWMKGKGNEAERQLHVNHVYDAFMDLADILGVPPKAMSLDGMLGIAVGAQGGGQNAAHFVPGINEINLTRTCGAGSLAHEWAHALDHYFGRLAGLERAGEPFLTEHATQGNEIVRQELVEGKWQRVVKARFGEELRPEVLAHFREIVQAMTKRPISADEVVERDAKYLASAEKAVDGWLKAVRRDFESARGKDGQVGATVMRGGVAVPVLEAFDGLANRVRSLDLGDGWVPAGKSRVVVPVVNEMRELYKEVTGRLYSLDNTLALQSNVDALRFARESAQGKKERRAELVNSDYLSAAQALDGGKAKPYWSTRLEMFARAFDVYVSERLEQKAAMNSYLSHAGRKDGTTPVGEERTAVVQAFDGLVGELRTRETERGVALFSRDAAFTADSYDARVFAEAVDRVAASGIAPRTDLTIGETPAVLRALGAKALPMQMPSSVIHKASRPDIRDHNVPVSVLKDLPALLANPVMVFDSQTEPGALVALVDARDDSDRPVLAAVHLDAQGGGFHKINKVASVYGKDDVAQIERWMQGNLRYCQMEKASQWLHAVGLQLPEANTIERLNPRVITETDVVKQLFSTDNRVTLGRGMDPRDVVDIVHRFGARWGRMPDVTVVASPDELPFPAPGNADGAFWKGGVWLVADNLRSVGQVQKVLAHECVLHYGIQEMLGATAYDELCYRIQGLKARGDKTVVGLATEVRQRYGLLSPREESGEIIARAGERCLDAEGNVKVEFGWMKSVYAGVASWLRKAGFEVPFSNVELQGMMHDAGRWIEKGRDQEVPAFGEAAAFSVGGESVVEGDKFKRWFGDSKVVDGEGRPLVVYHGTQTTGDAIQAFDLGQTGKRTDAGWLGRGFYFGDKLTADAYAGHREFDPDHYPVGGTVYPAYLALRNPAMLSDSERNDGPRTMVRELVDLADEASAQEVREALIDAGYDGVIYQRGVGRGYKEYVAFHPEQIKSAIGNNREFDPQNPNILFSLAEEREPVVRGNPFGEVAQVKGGQHIGPVVGVRDGFVLQDVGRGKQVVHDLKDIGGEVHVGIGDLVQVDY